MALSKTITTQYGVDATYWKISYGRIDTAGCTAVLEVKGWKDQASRDAGDVPLTSYNYPCSHPDCTFTNNVPLLSDCYTWLKTIDGTGAMGLEIDWTEATDA
jgi:hypothetical protein